MIRKSFYPVKDIVLVGICDIFARQARAIIGGNIFLCAYQLLLSTVKEVKVNGGIVLPDSIVMACSEKTLGATDDEIITAAIVSLVLQKATSMSQGVDCLVNMNEYGKKSIDKITESMEMTSGQLLSCRLIDAGISGDALLWQSILSEKSIYASNLSDIVNVAISILGIASKDIYAQNNLYAGTSCLHVSLFGLRTMSELDGLLFEDLQSWTMSSLYYLEV